MLFETETDPQNLQSRLFGRAGDVERYSRFFRPRAGRQRWIPKILHQIWLGGPMPQRLRHLSETWRARHPGWEFRLWTDDDLKDFKCADLMGQTGCFGQKSDLARAEILYQHGGVYVDLDYECYRPVDSLIAQSGFLVSLRWVIQACLGWPQLWPTPLMICNSFFGSAPGHPILAGYLSTVREKWNDHTRLKFSMSELDRISLFAIGGAKRAAHIKETAQRTYLPFHETVSANMENEDVVILPHTFMQPELHGWWKVYLMPQFWRLWHSSTCEFPKLWKYSGAKELSFANHRSHTSWL